MLEDDFNDVLTKAIRGKGFDLASLELDTQELNRCLDGEFDAEIISALAPKLGLDTNKLLRLPEYTPITRAFDEVHTFVSAFGHLGVNAFTITGDSHILIFDTGTCAHSMITHLARHPDKEKHLFITHPHPDHNSCESSLKPHAELNHHVELNKAIKFGNLTLTAFDIAGHHPNAIAYLIEGLKIPICVVGDALFAGSIGGVSQALYKTALSNIRKNLLSLPSETLILNGHGPSTTVKLEKLNNPFF